MLSLKKVFSSALSYTSRPYSEAMMMLLAVTYTPYATSSKEQTGGVITFAHFEEANILTKTCNDTERGDKSISESLMMKEQDMENIDKKGEFDDNHISTETLHEICDGNQTHPNVDKGKHVVKYVIALSKGNRNGKER